MSQGPPAASQPEDSHPEDGRLSLSLRASDTPELVGWVLHFGSGVRVVRPASFRDKVRKETRKIIEGK